MRQVSVAPIIKVASRIRQKEVIFTLKQVLKKLWEGRGNIKFAINFWT